MENKDERLTQDTRGSKLGEFQTIISIGYLIAVGIGMLFTYKKYNSYGINIFDYAEVFDFLIAPFSDLKIFIFSIVSIVVGLSFFRVDLYWQRRFPKSYSRLNLGLDKKNWFNVYRYIGYTAVIIVYLNMASNFYRDITTEEIEGQDPIWIEFADGEYKQGVLIGKTKDILFLKKHDTLTAIPITSLVKEFEIKSKEAE